MPKCQEIENGRLGLHGTEHLKCNHLITLGEGLKKKLQRARCAIKSERDAVAVAQSRT